MTAPIPKGVGFFGVRPISAVGFSSILKPHTGRKRVSHTREALKLTHKGRAKRHPMDETSKLMHKVTKLYIPINRDKLSKL